MTPRGVLTTEIDEDLRQHSSADSASHGGRVADLFAIAVDAIEQPVDQRVEKEDGADGFFREFRPIVASGDVCQFVPQDGALGIDRQVFPIARHEDHAAPAADKDRRRKSRVSS